MLNFLNAVCFWLFLTSVAAKMIMSDDNGLKNNDEDIREIQASIIQQLNQNRHLTAIEQNEEVRGLLDALEPATRQRYELWISELAELEKEKSNKLRAMMLQLSPDAQQTFAKILLAQQSENLSQDEKIKRVQEINEEMSPEVRKEIAEQVQNQETLKKFLNSWSY